MIHEVQKKCIDNFLSIPNTMPYSDCLINRNDFEVNEQTLATEFSL
jgi:hypothetical protein